TDEEDCSAADYDIFNVESSKYPLPNGDSNYHNVHCYLGEAPEKALHPVQRYIDGFLALRPNNSGLLVFGAITGVPLAFDDGGTSFTDLLKDPSMSYSEVQKASNLPYELKPVCDAGADGDAAPARRIVQVAQGLDAAGAGVTVRSICAPDYAPALDAIIRKIADALGGACLPRKLNPDAGGNVNCDVVEVLPLGVTCESLSGKGRSFLRSEKIDGESEPREVCRIAQLPAISTGDAAANPPSDPGWFYEFDDDANPNGNGGNPTDLEKRCGQGSQRISFASDSEPGTGSQLRLECLQPVVGSANGQVDVGEGCSAQGANTMCNAGSSLGADQCPTDVSLVCDPKSLTWQAPCDDDSDCSPFVCDTTRTFSDGTAAPSICVNPTCG
ncbi:MAG: hypothetical protein KC417_05070, partial [Myxococcales bacterium]|nr:hypothetical protein [Myxococcales bacterium]